ncbi:MAG: hypothetical protein UX17_C0008G0007 [Parcubacteria group bacterium GW2011_GWC2_45_7]|nr:MAG: hypothetical protein UX17_C0008G0007 [Parcubacteria group bacterium GW2011_GWC2_45_7]KKU73353.1 MAG: hypothetical protein UX98_C0008G0019 [Parcubacteria group bacterium GW2011_GWA2_47_26]
MDNINRYFTDNKASEKWKIEAAADDIRYQKKYETQFKGSTWPPLKEYLTKQEYQDYQRLLSCHDKYEEEERDLTLEALRIYSADPNTKWERRTQSKMGHARDYESDLYKAAVGDTVHLILNRHRNLKSGSSEYAIILIFVMKDGQSLDDERGRRFSPIHFEVDSDGNILDCFALRSLDKEAQQNILTEVQDQIKKLNDKYR